MARSGAPRSAGNKGGRPHKHDPLAPPCSRGHVGAGAYAERYCGAKRLRVLYRCTPADTSIRPHRYAATLPKVKVDDGTCDACEHDFTLHDGHQATREYTFTDREIASVLLALGKGVSYNRAAASIRGDAGRAMTTPRHGTLVTNWLDVYSPVVIAALTARTGPLPPAPHSIYVDAKPFKGNAVKSTGKKLKGGRVRFHVLAAVAHNPQGKPYTIKLWATKTITTKTWEKFLQMVAASFTGAPKWVVADGEFALVKAVTAVWPTASQWGCHSHIRTGAETRLKRAGVTSVTHPAWKTAQTMTGSQASFDKFRTEAAQVGDQKLLTWLNRVEPVLHGHWRETDPPRSKSAGQTESVLRHVVGKALEGRHRAMHNLPRLQLLCELLRLEENGTASQRRYQRILRDHLVKSAGRPANYAQDGHVKFTWDATVQIGKRGAKSRGAGRFVPPFSSAEWVD